MRKLPGLASMLLTCAAIGCATTPVDTGVDGGGSDGGDAGLIDAGATLAFCDGIADDPWGPTAASSLQKCIDAAPDGGAAELVAQLYFLNAQLLIDRPVTLRTAALGADTRTCTQPGIACAQLEAAADFDSDGGLIALGATDHAVLDHLIIDGNRSARLTSPAALGCLGGDRRRGENVSSNGCVSCSFTYSASNDALCGSALDWTGDGAQIFASIFQNNGDADAGFATDGVTLRSSNGASVLDNVFVDNSGVEISASGSRSGMIDDNQIRQVVVAASAGIWLQGPGDFTGTIVSSNSIDCGAQLCDFGILIGSHAFDSTIASSSGGLVSSSSVAGAKLGILAEGAGTEGAPLQIEFNVVSRQVATATFACGTRATYAIDLSPDSVIDAGADTAAVSSVTWHDCP